MDASQEPIAVDPVAKTQQIAKIQLSVPQFVLNANEMDVYVTMYTEEMRFVESQLVHIPPDVYKDWGTDDNHIINYVLSQLNLTKPPPPTEEAKS
jgi:hypothetical protein